MNEYLKEIAIKADAPKEILEELWFSVFCMKFADLIIAELENQYK